MMSLVDLFFILGLYTPNNGSCFKSYASKAVDKTPYKLWIGKVPKFSFLRIWGCQVYVKCLQQNKLKPKSDKVFFVDYPKETK